MTADPIDLVCPYCASALNVWEDDPDDPFSDGMGISCLTCGASWQGDGRASGMPRRTKRPGPGRVT